MVINGEESEQQRAKAGSSEYALHGVKAGVNMESCNQFIGVFSLYLLEGNGAKM